jgi:hydrogenase nickel incorporation protein HypB
MSKQINVVKNVLDANDALAAANRARLSQAGVLGVNLTSAPGSGKTTLLEVTLPALARRDIPAAVIVGDLQTSRDAERLEPYAAKVIQINTEGGCHLSASQVATALDALDLTSLGMVIIENVGNMVCPAGFDLGEHVRVAMLSTTEGDDKAAKYPTLFQPADVILLNKIDLIEILDFDRSRFQADLDQLNTAAARLELAAKQSTGLDAWVDWLIAARAAHTTVG